MRLQRNVRSALAGGGPELSQTVAGAQRGLDVSVEKDERKKPPVTQSDVGALPDCPERARVQSALRLCPSRSTSELDAGSRRGTERAAQPRVLRTSVPRGAGQAPAVPRCAARPETVGCGVWCIAR